MMTFQLSAAYLLSFLVRFVSAQIVPQPYPFFTSDLVPFTIALDSSNSFMYTAGHTSSSKPSPGGYFISKHSLNGTLMWLVRPNFTSIDYECGCGHPYKVLIDTVSGDLFFAGSSFGIYDNGISYYGGQGDGLFMRYRSNGTRVWATSLQSTGQDYLQDMILQSSSQRLVVAGYDDTNVIILASMINGSISKRYDGSNAVLPTGDTVAIVQGETLETVYIAGRFWSSFSEMVRIGNSDGCTSKFLLNGTRVWTVDLGTPNYWDYIHSVWFDQKANLVFSVGSSDRPVLQVMSTNGSLFNRILLDIGGGEADTVVFHALSQTIFFAGESPDGTGFFVNCTMNSRNFSSVLLRTSSKGRQILLSADSKTLFLVDGSSTLYVGSSASSDLANSSLPGTSQSSFATSSSLQTTKLPPLSATTTVAMTAVQTSSTLPAPTSATFAKSMSTMKPFMPVETSMTPSSTVETPTVIETAPLMEVVADLPIKLSLISMLIIGGIANVFLFALFMLTVCWCFKLSRDKNKKKSRGILSSTFLGSRSSSYASSLSSSANTQRTSQPFVHSSSYKTSSDTLTQKSLLTTFMRSDFELSLPGFLMFESKSSFRVKKQLAKGGGGYVALADALTLELAAYGSTIIVKTAGSQVGSPLFQMADRDQKRFKQEIAMMHFFRNERHIAKLLGWSDNPACILMKFYPRGSLDKWIECHGLQTKTFQLRFIKDISRGITVMHDAGFVHCDLKPPNVLVDEDEQGRLFCCLTDFGISQIVDETSLLVKEFAVINVRGLSVHYAAPEAFQRFRAKAATTAVTADYAMKVDLFSLGMIMLELLERQQPWRNGV